MSITDTELQKLAENPDKSVAEVGKDILLYVNKGADATAPEWQLVGGQRNSPLNKTADSIDASHKTSGGWKQNLSGLKSWTVDYSGLLILDDDGVAILDYAFNNDKQVFVKIEYSNKTYQTGWAHVTSFNTDSSHTDVATLSVTLTGVGAISGITKPTETTGA